MFELLAGHDDIQPLFKKLERIADAPFRLYCNSIITYGNGIYVIGGNGGPTDPDRGIQSYATMLYNTTTGQWTRKADVPDVLLRAPICLHNGLIWVLGTTKMMTYDPFTDVWTVRQNVGFSLRSARMFGYGDYLYFFGGEYNGANVFEGLQRYHIPTATFETVTTPGTVPYGRAYYGACQDGKHIYMYGGYRPSAQPPSGQFSQFWRYDIELNQWTLLSTAFDVAMHTHQIRYHNGRVITGGSWSNGVDSGQTYEYDIAKARWVRGQRMTYRGWWLSFEIVGEEGFLLGGSDNASFTGATPQIWKLSK